MTANEFRNLLNRVFGMNQEWPKTFEVDQDTYDNCAAELANWEERNEILLGDPTKPKKKLMFKNVELILKK